MKIRTTAIAKSVVVASVLAVSLTACGDSNSSSDSTSAPDTTIVSDTTTPTEESSTTVAAKVAAYCNIQSTIADIDMANLTQEQAGVAAEEIDKVYTSLTADMKTHAGPLLDFYMQFTQMGGQPSQTFVDHNAELNTLLTAACK